GMNSTQEPCAAGPVSGRCQVAPFRPSGYHSRTRGLSKIPAALAGEACEGVQLFDSIKGESRMRSQPDIDYNALVKEDRVHISLYTDPDIFTDEMDKIFRRVWVYVGHQGEVPNPGDFRLKRIGLQPVIMVRDQHGQVQLLLNRCRHRGATVCQEKQGNTRSFRCMYHGWTYHLDGELSGVPSEEAYGDDFKRQELSLVKVPRVAAYRGFIFASLSTAGIPLEEHLGRAAAELDLFFGLSADTD